VGDENKKKQARQEIGEIRKIDPLLFIRLNTYVTLTIKGYLSAF